MNSIKLRDLDKLLFYIEKNKNNREELVDKITKHDNSTYWITNTDWLIWLTIIVLEERAFEIKLGYKGKAYRLRTWLPTSPNALLVAKRRAKNFKKDIIAVPNHPLTPTTWAIWQEE